MAHGTKPYGRTGALDTVHGVADLGELAARLGTPDTFDRRGNVMWWDSFEGGVEKWFPLLSGAGAAVLWEALWARTGGFACALWVGSNLNEWAGIERYIAYPTMSRFGLEVSFNPNGFCPITEMYLELAPAPAQTMGALRYDINAGTLEYLDAAGLWVMLDPVFVVAGWANAFSTFKLVIDPANNSYVRVIANERAYAMQGIPLAPAVSPLPAVLRVRIYAIGVFAMNVPERIDDVIITQNEP